MTSDETIARLRRSLTDAKAALSDPNMEPRRTVSQQLAEAHRVLVERLSEINGIDSAITKCSARVDQLRADHAGTGDAIARGEDQGANALTEAERYAWREAVRHLKGESSGYDVPGPVVMMRRESGRRLPTLATVDEELSRAEADLAGHLERLRVAAASWDARNVVTGDVTTNLPPMQARATATVK